MFLLIHSGNSKARMGRNSFYQMKIKVHELAQTGSGIRFPELDIENQACTKNTVHPEGRIYRVQ